MLENVYEINISCMCWSIFYYTGNTLIFKKVYETYRKVSTLKVSLQYIWRWKKTTGQCRQCKHKKTRLKNTIMQHLFWNCYLLVQCFNRKKNQESKTFYTLEFEAGEKIISGSKCFWQFCIQFRFKKSAQQNPIANPPDAKPANTNPHQSPSH